MKALAIMEGHLDACLDAPGRVFDDAPMVALVRLKPGELVGRLVERNIVPLLPPPPAMAQRDWESLTLEEQESENRRIAASAEGVDQPGGVSAALRQGHAAAHSSSTDRD